MKASIPLTGKIKKKIPLTGVELKALKAMALQQVEIFDVEKLEKLADAAGVHPNTLRYAIEQGEASKSIIEKIRENLLKTAC